MRAVLRGFSSVRSERFWCWLDVALPLAPVGTDGNRCQPVATVRTRPQPPATVRNEGDMAPIATAPKAVAIFWGCLDRLEVSVLYGRQNTSWHSGVFDEVWKVALSDRHNTS